MAAISDDPVLSTGGHADGKGTRARPRATGIWTGTFALICASQSLGYLHQGLLVPTIPLWITTLGGSEIAVGLVLASFSVASFLLRPLIGAWTDSWSAIGILSLGSLLLALSGLALLIPVLWVAALVNAVRGVGWAGLNTGGGTLLAHVAPPARRGEASGYYNLCQNGAATMAAPLALWLLGTVHLSFPNLFLLAAAVALCGALLSRLISLPASAVPPAPRKATVAVAAKVGDLPRNEAVAGARRFERFYDRGMLLPSVLLALLMLTQPAMTGFIPLFAFRELHIPFDQVSLYFLASGVTTLLIRGAVGGVSDRVGRAPIIVAGFIASALGLAMVVASSSLAMLIIAAVLYGVGASANTPATLALAIDRANVSRRGAAMASYSLAYQVGIGFGAAAAGYIAETLGYRTMYLAAIGALAAGVLFTLVNWREIGLRPSATVA